MPTRIEYGLLTAAVGLTVLSAVPVITGKTSEGSQKNIVLVNGSEVAGPVCVEAGAELGGGSFVYIFTSSNKAPEVLSIDQSEVASRCKK